MTPRFLDRLHAAAEAQGCAESEYRDESRRRLLALAADRTRAYRRYNLLKDMADLAGAQEEAAASATAQTSLATREAGWLEPIEGYAEVCERLRAVALLIHAELHVGQTEAPARPVDEAFSDFESWHRERFGGEFLDRAQRETPFYPVVDF